VKRPGEAGLGKSPVEVVGLPLRVGIDQHDGVDRRAVLVISVDPPQVLTYKRASREPPGVHGIVNLRDSGFLHLEALTRKHDRGTASHL
jgi:hypothetical protein